MKLYQKFIYIFFIALLINFVVDYILYETFNWVENTLHSVVFVVFYMFFTWAWNSKDYKKKKQQKSDECSDSKF